VKDGSRFDTWTSAVIIVGYAIPGFLFAILLIILLAAGRSSTYSRCGGLTSDGWSQFPWYWENYRLLLAPHAAVDLDGAERLRHHDAADQRIPFLDEIRKQYVMTARAKGCRERQVLYNHIFRNAMLIVIAGFPGAFISAFSMARF